MSTMSRTATLRTALAAILARVRRRWRLRRALLGAVWFLALAAGVALVAAFSVDAWRFAPEVVTGARIVGWFVIGIAFVFVIAVPLFRRVSDRQLALFAPGVQTVVDQAAWQPTQHEPREAPGQPVEPAARKHAAGQLHRPALAPRQMPFLGFGWLLKKRLNFASCGYDTLEEKQQVMDRAVDEGILYLYKVPNIDGKTDPVTACKLNHEHGLVKDHLAREKDSQTDEDEDTDQEQDHVEAASVSDASDLTDT